jgi:hypothetical protein
MRSMCAEDSDCIASICIDCRAGEYSETENSAACQKCQLGQYQNEQGKFFCRGRLVYECNVSHTVYECSVCVCNV